MGSQKPTENLEVGLGSLHPRFSQCGTRGGVALELLVEKACVIVELCSGDPCCSRVGPGRAEQGPVSTPFAGGGTEIESGLEAPPSRPASSEPVLPPQNSPCLGAVAAGEDGAGLQARRFRPGGCPLPALQLPHLCGVVFLTPWVRVTQLTSHLLLLDQGLGEPLREWLQRPPCLPPDERSVSQAPGAAVSCLNLLSLGFCPSTCSGNLAEFLHFFALVAFAGGKQNSEDNLLLDARLKPRVN